MAFRSATKHAYSRFRLFLAVAGRRRYGTCMAHAPTVDEAEVARFSALAEQWWDQRGKMAVLHRFNPVRLGYIRDAACAAVRPRSQTRSIASPACASSTSAAAAASCPSRWRGSAPSVVGADPSDGQYRGRAAACRATADSRSTTAARPRRRSPTPASASTSCWRWKWSSTSPTCDLFVRRCAEMVKPGGLMIAGHAQPHAQELRAGDRRRRVRARLAAARHPSLGQVRHAERARDRAGSWPACASLDETGVIYNPLADRWQLSSDMDVNYMMHGGRRGRLPRAYR